MKHIMMLSIPAQQHRVWATLGHLDTLGFPVRDIKRLIIYNGRDFKDHEKVNTFTDCVTWGMLRIMEKVIECDEPALVIENDAFFCNLEVTPIKNAFKFLHGEWKRLIETEGYNNINVACFTMDYYKHNPYYIDNSGAEQIDSFWCKGARCISQTANIYTPHGAQFILDNLPTRRNIEMFVYCGDNKLTEDKQPVYTTVEGVYSSYCPVITPYFYPNFDSFRVSRDADVMFNHYRGETL